MFNTPLQEIATDAISQASKATKSKARNSVIELIDYLLPKIKDSEVDKMVIGRLLRDLYSHHCLPRRPKKNLSTLDWVKNAAEFPRHDCETDSYRYFYVFDNGSCYATNGSRIHMMSGCDLEPGVYNLYDECEVHNFEEFPFKVPNFTGQLSTAGAQTFKSHEIRYIGDYDEGVGAFAWVVSESDHKTLMAISLNFLEDALAKFGGDDARIYVWPEFSKIVFQTNDTASVISGFKTTGFVKPGTN